jgi:hypothetical protein
MKPNCYTCRWRGDVPGDAHSSCQHPKAQATHTHPVNQLAAILGKRSGLDGCLLSQEATDLHIEAVPHGIRMGWFLWPVNFDPTWLVRCDGYELSDAQQT